jgi:hypothetical protein
MFLNVVEWQVSKYKIRLGSVDSEKTENIEADNTSAKQDTSTTRNNQVSPEP